MAQSVKCLLYAHENLSSDAQIPHKKPVVAPPLNTLRAGAGTGGFSELRAPHWMGTGFSERPCLKESGGEPQGRTLGIDLCSPHVSALTCTGHTHKNTYTKNRLL